LCVCAAYSIVPIGESERANVLGDYFTADYAYMWARDLPMLRSVGVNTLRIYSWDMKADHTAFLDACSQHDMKVFITHAIGYARDNPVDTVAKQDAIVKGFADEVARYGDHPAILMWSFGNEMNGYWLGFLDQFNTVYQCNWNSIQVEQGGCIRSTTPACLAAQDCIYSQYFGWLDRALAAGKNHTTRPMTATFADIDNIVGQNPQTDLLPRFAKNMTHFDAYAFQVRLPFTSQLAQECLSSVVALFAMIDCFRAALFVFCVAVVCSVVPRQDVLPSPEGRRGSTGLLQPVRRRSRWQAAHRSRIWSGRFERPLRMAGELLVHATVHCVHARTERTAQRL